MINRINESIVRVEEYAIRNEEQLRRTVIHALALSALPLYVSGFFLACIGFFWAPVVLLSFCTVIGFVGLIVLGTIQQAKRDSIEEFARKFACDRVQMHGGLLDLSNRLEGLNDEQKKELFEGICKLPANLTLKIGDQKFKNIPHIARKSNPTEWERLDLAELIAHFDEPKAIKIFEELDSSPDIVVRLLAKIYLAPHCNPKRMVILLLEAQLLIKEVEKKFPGVKKKFERIFLVIFLFNTEIWDGVLADETISYAFRAYAAFQYVSHRKNMDPVKRQEYRLFASNYCHAVLNDENALQRDVEIALAISPLDFECFECPKNFR